jgi:hypothetical protein
MKDLSAHIEALQCALDTVDSARLMRGSSLDAEETDSLSEGVGMLAEPLSTLCRRLLNEWDHVSAETRVAALLVLANALAASDDSSASS